MAYSIEVAKELVVLAGKRLVESGLIARTWGNISARISDTQFVITPSGLAYETLTSKQIVTVNIADCSYEGGIKPSSEKGIHADAYHLRPQVNFIIHTHQQMASVISIEGENLKIQDKEEKKILGDVVPCAAYGMPSTAKLRERVAEAVRANPQSKAVLLKYHGTLCMGDDPEQCFLIAATLETVAEERYKSVCVPDPITSSETTAGEGAKIPVEDYGISVRTGNSFLLKYNGVPAQFEIDHLPEGAPKAAVLHAEIYQHSKVNHIIHTTGTKIMKVSTAGRMVRPFLDDLAQIAGVNIKSVRNGFDHPKRVARELKQKNALLLENAGALCTGITEDDARAVGMVLEKGCAADMYASALHKTNSLSLPDAYLQRLVYVLKYSKQKK